MDQFVIVTNTSAKMEKNEADLEKKATLEDVDVIFEINQKMQRVIVLYVYDN